MFDLTERRVAWLPVEFKGFVSEGDEAGKVVTRKVDIQVDLVDSDEFKRMFVQPETKEMREQIPALAAAYAALPEAERAEADAREAAFAKLTDLERFDTLAQGWRKVVAGKSPVPFTPENRAKMMKVPNFPLAFFQAYANAWQGLPETREGNSEDSPASGPAASESE